MVDKGPVQILCTEIGAVFTDNMETTATLVAFVSVLVAEVEQMMETADTISDLTGKPVSPASKGALGLVKRLLSVSCRAELIEGAAKIHYAMHLPDEGFIDPHVSMLNSCTCAIRFGLETPCNSRWPAEAASHIWKKKYGVSLFDHHSNKWGKQWARDKFYEALGSL